MSRQFSDRIGEITDRVNQCIEQVLPGVGTTPARLHEAMRYAVLNGGKRVRPLFVYATGDCLQIDSTRLDPVAVSIELIHAFSLVHDDLPVMDDDDLRRGKPTVHRAYDEATAILAADALQPLAFQTLAQSPSLSDSEKVRVIGRVAAACGSTGMTGGQSIDLQSEGVAISSGELRTLHSMKTGALLAACVETVCELSGSVTAEDRDSLGTFAQKIGLAFQIRDDILDVEGETDVIGKLAGADQNRGKATWPATFGLEESRRQCSELLESGLLQLDRFGDRAAALRWLATYVVTRSS